MDRRNFIKKTGVAFSALPLYTATFQTTTYRIALIGSGWWGMNILREAIAYGNCKVVAICDVDKTARETASQEVQTLNGDKPKLYNDFRDMISTEKPDITIVATPDHWHAIPAITAINSGSHLYIEKPISHTIEEGRAILNAARANGRTVQVGTHRRHSPHNIAAMEMLRSGKVGQINQVKTFVNYRQNPGTPQPDTDAPEGFDWDFWQGPAPKRNFNPGIHPRGFRRYMDYANGTISDWGVHWFNQVLWWTEEKYPKTIFSKGDIYYKTDGSDVPDTQLAIYEFESFILEWEHKKGALNENENHNVGCYFYGSEGTLHIGWREGTTFYPHNKNQEIINIPPQLNKPDDQNIKECWNDFIGSIENNRLPISDIEAGYYSTNISLLAMISYKLGRSIEWDGEKEQFKNDKEANALLSKKYLNGWSLPG